MNNPSDNPTSGDSGYDNNPEEGQAFEYVLGTLRGAERDAFTEKLRHDDTLAAQVRFWEETITPAADTLTELAPAPATLQNIQTTLNNRHNRSVPSQPERFWQKLLPWKTATAIAFCLLFVVSGVLVTNLTTPPGQTLNAAYVAVLVDESDNPVLTALTASDGSTLWLKWENWEKPDGHSLQLWSQSRRDGEIRPLAVFGGAEKNAIALDQANWRLIKDSSHLFITREEVGGSPIDEPSEQIIATGVCIRLEKASDNA